VVDGDDGDQWILAGIHTVNRICFFALSHYTKQRPLLRIACLVHDWKDIQFRIPRRGYSLTRIGLLRQMNKLNGPA